MLPGFIFFKLTFYNTILDMYSEKAQPFVEITGLKQKFVFKRDSVTIW
jgi:hypothetical protein